ncbi:hypothetical protein FRC19_001278 [Serendipita sp. 401]|nr:hypothetical protein FRC16_001619 [Serendipita sp. 398]KAG8815088.1 hypothetical protein FRC19_001278 [Serendipita sp. 401]KAG8863428.1 hypothetical protein FRC20_010748 [Serendipita sp. 405]KAG9021626.1 hypothetical protein FS842_006531 [Serendipita sp. 407]
MNQVHLDSVSEKAVRRRYKGPKTISYDSTFPRVRMASASTSGSQQPTATQKLANKARERCLTNQLYEKEFKDDYNHFWWSATYIAAFLDSTGTQRQVTIGWCIRPHCSKQDAHEEAANCALKILDADPTIDGRVPSTQ